MTWIRWAYHAWGDYWFDHPALFALVALLLVFGWFVSSIRPR